MSKSPRQRKKRFSDKKTEKLVSLYETLKPRANSEWEALSEEFNESLAEGEGEREPKPFK